MRLPGISYGGGVQSLGREDVTAPLRELEAKKAITSGIANLADTLGRQEAVAQYSDAWTRYREQVGEFTANSTAEQYKSVPVDEADPAKGNRAVSRHDDLIPEYDTAEKDIRESIAKSITNGQARAKFEESTTEYNLRNRSNVYDKSLDWAKRDTQLVVNKSIQEGLENNNFALAREAYQNGAAAGIFTVKQRLEIPKFINATEQYNKASDTLAAAVGPADFLAFRAGIADDKLYPDLGDKQKNSLLASLSQRIEENLVTSVREIAEKRGTKAAEYAFHAVNKTDYKKLGLGTQQEKREILKELKGVVNDYRAWKSTAKDKIYDEERIAAISNGVPTDPKSASDKRLMDESLKRRTDGMQLLSPEWTTEVSKFGQQQGWIPPAAESAVRSHLLSEDPANVVSAARALLDIEKTAPRALDNFNRDDIAFGLAINQYSSLGVPEITTIAKIREGIYRVPETIRKGRAERFDKEYSKEIDVTIKDLIADDGQANPWFSFAAEGNDNLTIEFSNVYRDEYIRTGDTKVAARLAYRTMRNVYAVTDRGAGGLKMERNAPESKFSDGSPTAWLTEQYNVELEDIGIDPDTVHLVFDHSNPANKKWFIVDNETLEIKLDDKGMLMMWSPDRKTSPQGKRDAMRAERLAKRADLVRERQIRAEKGRPLNPSFGDTGTDERGMKTVYIPTIADLAAGKDIDEGALVNRGLTEGADAFFDFFLKDVPEAVDKSFDKLPHNRQWVKDMKEKARKDAYNK